MSPLPDIDALLPDDASRRVRRDALVSELRPTAATTPAPALTRRRLVQVGVVGVGALAVGLVGTTVVPGTDGSPVDVLGSARAAAAPVTGGILHTVVRGEASPDLGPLHLLSGSPETPETDLVRGTVGDTTERWSTTEPFREHVVRDVTIEGREGTVKDETSYAADGTYRERSFWQQDVVREQRLGAKGRRATERLSERADSPTLLGVGSSTDPVAVLRRLLNSGRLRPDGTTTVDGRDVRRLVGNDPGPAAPGSDSILPTRVEILVDADDFTPVRITTTHVVPARPDAEEPAARRDRTVRFTSTFETYERLPLNAETAGLLEVDTAGRRVVEGD